MLRFLLTERKETGRWVAKLKVREDSMNNRTAALAEMELKRLGINKPSIEVDQLGALMYSNFMSWLTEWPKGDKELLREWFIRHAAILDDTLEDIEEALYDCLVRQAEDVLLDLMGLPRERGENDDNAT